MVEEFNHSLLQLFRSYGELKSDWERYLPLVLCAYRTAAHSSTSVSHIMLMSSQSQSRPQLATANVFDFTSYFAHLTDKLAELHEFVESRLGAATHEHKKSYDKHVLNCSFLIGDPVWLVIHTDGKFHTRGLIKAIKSVENVEITKTAVPQKWSMLTGCTTELLHMLQLESIYPSTATNNCKPRNSGPLLPLITPSYTSLPKKNLQSPRLVRMVKLEDEFQPRGKSVA